MNTRAIGEALARQLTPAERLSVSEWAEKSFQIVEKGAILPGPYDLSLTPFWREPLDALGDPAVRRMNIVACAQSGKTQLGNVGLAYWATHAPANVLYVRPTEPDIIEAFRDRFRPMIEANLRHLIVGTDWLTVTRNPAIMLTSCIIYGAAASVARHMTSRTTLRVIYDETDTAEESSNSLGDVLSLLDERQMAGSAARSITLGMSTPKLDTGSNWMAYEHHSDRREFAEPCPLCGHYQFLRMDAIRGVEGERDPATLRRLRAARLVCEDCGGEIHPDRQGWMADRGVWVPRGCEINERLPLDDGQIVDVASLAINPAHARWEPAIEGPRWENDHRGFRLWRANTKFEQCSWPNILARFHETRGDSTRFQVFANNWLAEPWRDAIEPADEDVLKNCVGDLPRGRVPSQARVLLGGVDCQHDRIYYVVRAFGPNQETWLVDHGRIEIGQSEGVRDLLGALETFYDRFFQRGYQATPDADGPMVRGYSMAVDSGDQTDAVYEFVASHPGVIPVKGRDLADFRVRPSKVEGKRSMRPLTLWQVNTKAFKNRLQRLIAASPGEPGEWHLHRDTTEDYMRQMTSEHLVRKRGNRVATWQLRSSGRENHYLDCETYCAALAEALEQVGELNVLNVRETDPVVGWYRPRAVADPERVKAPRPRSGGGGENNPGGGWTDGAPTW